MTESTPTPNYQQRSRSRKTAFVWIAALIGVAVVAVIVFALALGGKSQAPAPEGSEITVGLTLEPTNLNIRETGGVALDQILIDNVYQGLVGLASGTVDEYVPVLASELPTVSDDGLSYTFELREGIVFDSGAELTTQDVVSSLSATLVPDVIGSAATVTSADDRTIVIALDEPNSQLLWHLANRPGLIFEEAYDGDLANTANGTGPYSLEEWRQGDSITFVARDEYWGDPADIETVIWRYLPDPNAAVNAALEGDLDVLAPVSSALVSQLEGDERYTLTRAASTDVFTLGYNTAKTPLNDVRVRQALSQAIDGDAIVEAFYGDGKPLGSPVTDIEPAYEDFTDVNAYDPESARELLAAAGYADGLELTLTVPNFYGLEAINQLVSQFAEVGVTLNVDAVEFGVWLSDVYAAPEDGGVRSFDLSYIDHAEPNDFVNYVTDGYYFGTVNPEAQQLYAQSIAAADSDEATALLQQAVKLVVHDAPAKWLINYTPTNAVASNVSGFPESNTNSRINLAGVTVE